MPIVEGARSTHTTLESANIARSMRFCREVMGVEAISRPGAKAGHIRGTNGHWAAYVELARRAPQPLLNYYARPVADARAVDAAHERIRAVQAEYAIQDITPPAREDPTRFGVDTYGFYLQDADANWWRVEENVGPFGPVALPADAEPHGSLVPAGPISYVTLECRDLGATLRFYRDFLGLDAEQRGPHWFVSRGNGGIQVLGVAVGDRLADQPVMNHHGITLWTDAEHINRLRALAVERADEYGILKVLPATSQHGSYSFYFQDLDTNWWEVEIWEDGLDAWTRAVQRHEERLAATNRGPGAVSQ